jgi:hypothetical protein
LKCSQPPLQEQQQQNNNRNNDNRGFEVQPRGFEA